MDFRKSLSKPFKKLKGKLPGGTRKRDGRSGNENDRKLGEADVEGSEASQRDSYLHSEVDVESVVGSVPGREGIDVDGNEAAPVDDPPTPTPPISQSGKSDSM